MVNTFVESVGVQPCCQTMNGLVVPRWDLWMSNRGKARDFFESWLHVQMRDSPGSDLTYQVLVFLERLFMAGLKLYGEDHRDVWENPEDFFVRMLRHEGQLGYTIWDYILHLLIDRYIYICVCIFTWFCWMQRKLYNHLTSILFEKHYGCVFCFTERCFPESNEVPCRRSENMACWREQRLVGGEKAMWSKFEGSVWLVARCETKRHHAAVGWTQCSFFAMAIMRSIYGTCAIYVYKIFQLDWNTWTPTYICILRSYTVYE